jgi:hypothetical protein
LFVQGGRGGFIDTPDRRSKLQKIPQLLADKSRHDEELAEVKAQGRSEALTNARKRRKKTQVLLEKPHARDGKDRTGEQRQALGSDFEFGSQASGGTSSVNTAPAGLSPR